MGGETANKAISQADMRQFFTQHYQPQNAHLLVVGDVTAAAVLPKLERAFGTWKNAGAIPKVTLPPAPQPASRQIYMLDKPGAAQSQIRMGAIGVARSTPDYFVLDVLNTMLGGSFTSRLNQNLREEHGYSYGAGSAFAMRLEPGPFAAQAGVQTDKTVESLVEFFKELDGIRAPAPDGEVTRARSLEALSFPGSFETTSEMAGQLADLVVYGLPETFFNEYVPRIQAVRPADVQRAATQYLQSNKFVVVVAGDLSKIEKPVRNQDLAPVTILDPAAILK
jgi:predicted Zn-dependent peptidase